MKYLITVVGPTAIGKTAMSIALANEYHCPIVSCDSRQFFKEMTIGTAVPNATELAAAQHYFIQNKSIYDSYTVGDYEKEALATLDKLFQTHDYVILVGGSGLYVNAVLKGFDSFPEIDPKIRKAVNDKYEQEGLAFLQNALALLDPDYYKTIANENPQTLQNPQRMMRFVEVCMGTNQPYSSFLNQEKVNRNFVPIIIGLEANRTLIYNRINQRVDIMLQEGLLEEAQKLIPHKTLNALQTVGYKELFDYFEGKTTLDFAIEEIKKNTRRFSKRQLTWFKRESKTKWFDYKILHKDVIDHINNKTKF